MKKLKKLFALALIASVAFASCKKKATEDDLNALKAELEKEQAETQALADSLAAQQQRDSLADAQQQDGYIKGTFSGTREDDPNTSTNEEGQAVSFPFEFKYKTDGIGYFSSSDADAEPEDFDFYRYEKNSYDYGYFGMRFTMDLPGTLTPSSFNYINGRFYSKLSSGQDFQYRFYWNTSYVAITTTFSNVSYSNGRLKANYTISIPAGNNSGYYNNNAATITGSFDITAKVAY
ncbi:MAG: hypothetical protein SFU27_00120 [Thermonemataceae bacterium]|nr:hypothetical protein [Thermonemataceae bacterium]